MTARAMKCIKSAAHPNADALRVYEFNHEDTTLQIVANMENVYEIGDVAIIVEAGSTLLDGTNIKIASLRGVKSQGMALGKTDVPVGTDLTKEHCQPEVAPTKASMIPWPDIESLFNIRRYLVQNNIARKISYRAKIKLDGTNAGVQLFPSDADFVGPHIVAQSRSRIITVDSDNMNFAKWVVINLPTFLDVRKNADAEGVTEHITVFGEWCGKGIQKRTAISRIEKQIFAIFAVQIGLRDNAKFETDPERLGRIIFGTSDGKRPEGDAKWETIHILPWEGDIQELDYSNADRLAHDADIINQKVEAVEKCDPWVKETFGVEGLGEGVVMYPILNGNTLIDRVDYTDLVFKAKGEKHKVVNAKKPAQIDPEFVATIDDFVELMVTENRLEQIAQKVGEFHKKNIGIFMKELSQDVNKESEAELEESNLEWKQVAKAVGNKARKWFMAKCDDL